jgi:hypothetical protein
VEAGRGSGPGRRRRKKKETEQIDEAAATLLAQSLKLIAQAETGACDLPCVEARLRDAALGFAAKAVGVAMSGPLQRAAGVGAPSGRRELRAKNILSAVGEVSYTRWYAVDPAGGRGFPADDALGIVCGCTVGVAKGLRSGRPCARRKAA